MLGSLKMANLGLSFLLELCALAAFGYWGYVTPTDQIAKIGLAIGAPVVAAAIWGVFASPRAPLRIPGLWHLAFAASFFALAALSLAVAGPYVLALIFGCAFIFNYSLLYIWGQA